MALAVKRYRLKHVPWFSVSEWHEVYKAIYSNDTVEQTKGYERLLLWKSRLPKLPVGVECTMSIIEVCLRDREITPKIESGELPPYYENDLCLMYSTTIMRFLNHVTNVGRTKLTSLFQIAKQLRIPSWIVNIRHEAAHGHELPSISELRIATNILLEWLHEEYWAAETKTLEAVGALKHTEEDNEPEEVQTLTDLIELWIAIGLYIHAGYTSVKEVPDEHLRETLSDLRVYVLNLKPDENSEEETPESRKKLPRIHRDLNPENDNYKLRTGQSVLLSEISRYLSKNKSLTNKDDIVLNVLFEGDAFLPSKEFLEIFERNIPKSGSGEGPSLPLSLTQFWQEFITLLHEKEILEKLILRLLKLVNDEREKEDKRLTASLWIKYVASSLCKIKVSQQIKHGMEKARENTKKKLSSTVLSVRLQDEVDRSFPELKEILWFNTLGEIPSFLTDLNFVKKILSGLNNKLSNHFVEPLLELVTPSLDDDLKSNLLRFIRVYTGEEKIDCQENNVEGVKTIDDFVQLFKPCNNDDARDETFLGLSKVDKIEIGDQTVRNSSWKLEPDTFDWGNCPFGILPWQLESMDTVDTILSKSLTCGKASKEFDVVPGIVDGKSLTMRSKINWDSVLGKKKKPKRKRNRESLHNMVDKAIRIVKKKHC